jgi:hypothetical protein
MSRSPVFGCDGCFVTYGTAAFVASVLDYFIGAPFEPLLEEWDMDRNRRSDGYYVGGLGQASTAYAAQVALQVRIPHLAHIVDDFQQDGVHLAFAFVVHGYEFSGVCGFDFGLHGGFLG